MLEPPTIPVVDARDAAELFQLQLVRGEALRQSCLSGAPPAIVSLHDFLSRTWLARTTSPYQSELKAIAANAAGPGVFALNLAYEWACTTGVTLSRTGNRLVRIFDWRFNGLGRNVVVARLPGLAGSYLNITWPGYVGVLTAVAPGRFAAALNHAPLRYRTGWKFCDRLLHATSVFAMGGQPASHLLRHVFETAPDYDTALKMLTDPSVRVAAPAIIVLVGCQPREACIIERMEYVSFVYSPGTDGRLTAANDWRSPGLRGWPRSGGATLAAMRSDCLRRCEGLTAALANPMSDFQWLGPPVLNDNTRVAVLTDPSENLLAVQGFEKLRNGELPSMATTLLWLETDTFPHSHQPRLSAQE